MLTAPTAAQESVGVGAPKRAIHGPAAVAPATMACGVRV
jgi:hypothetical protein